MKNTNESSLYSQKFFKILFVAIITGTMGLLASRIKMSEANSPGPSPASVNVTK